MQNAVQVRYEQTEVGRTVTLNPAGHSSTSMRQFQDEVKHVRALESQGLVDIVAEHTSSDHGIDWLDQITFVRLK